MGIPKSLSKCHSGQTTIYFFHESNFCESCPPTLRGRPGLPGIARHPKIIAVIPPCLAGGITFYSFYYYQEYHGITRSQGVELGINWLLKEGMSICASAPLL